MKSLASVSDVKNGRGQNRTESIDPFETIGLPGRQAYNFLCLHWFSAHVRQAKRVYQPRDPSLFIKVDNALRPLLAPSGCLFSARASARRYLLIEGNTRRNAIIKFLTQSTWSCAALCLGEQPVAQTSIPRTTGSQIHDQLDATRQ